VPRRPAGGGPSGRLPRLLSGRRGTKGAFDGEQTRHMGWTAYIIRSVKDGTFYKGSCKECERRLEDHNYGRVRSTKGRRPWVDHYREEFDTKSEALRREKFFKSRTGYRWLKSKGIT